MKVEGCLEHSTGRMGSFFENGHHILALSEFRLSGAADWLLCGSGP